MSLKVGDTFFVSGTGGVNNPSGAHLMICLVVNTRNDTAVIVPLVTQRAYSDKSCVLTVGDHPFIKHDSCAAYDHLTAICLSEANTKIKSGALKLRTQVSTAVLVRLQVGLVTSDETQPWAFTEANGTALIAHLKHRGHL